jgi:hypothetical protein
LNRRSQGIENRDGASQGRGKFLPRGEFRTLLRNQNQFAEYKWGKEHSMRFLLVAAILAAPAFSSQADRFSSRWAREDARQAQREAIRNRAEARHYAVEARREVTRDRAQALRERLRYRNELRRELRDNLREERPDTSGMKRIFD